jgi:DNA polymerase-3 subunit delta'
MTFAPPATSILGQARAVRQVATALRRGCLSHALIFHGPFGVGKFTTAMAFARLVLDPEATDENLERFDPPAGTRVGALIDSGAHPDLHVIRKELVAFSDNAMLRNRKQQNIPLDLLRERMLGGRTGDDRWHDAPVSKTPLRGHGKVFIIDEAELLQEEGQNALLKTLEEPPPGTYIVLVTTDERRLLPTIRSRCQRVGFGPLDDESMARWMDGAGLDLDVQQREWIASYAAGSPGTAVIAAEHRFFDWHRTLDPMIRELEAGAYPVELAETMATLVNDFAEARVKSRPNASKEAANRAGARHLLALLAARARRSLCHAAERGETPDAALQLVDLLRTAERAMMSNVQVRLVLASLVAQWASMR